EAAASQERSVALFYEELERKQCWSDTKRSTALFSMKSQERSLALFYEELEKQRRARERSVALFQWRYSMKSQTELFSMKSQERSLALFYEEVEKQRRARERSVALFYEELERKRGLARQRSERYSMKN
ncbi:unnamed protein product, partial [Effrenium voratum]